MNKPTPETFKVIGALYYERLNRLAAEQLAAIRDGLPARAVLLTPPSETEVQIIERSLRDAKDRGLHEAWGIADDHASGARKGTKRNLGDEIAEAINGCKATDYALATGGAQ